MVLLFFKKPANIRKISVGWASFFDRLFAFGFSEYGHGIRNLRDPLLRYRSSRVIVKHVFENLFGFQEIFLGGGFVVLHREVAEIVTGFFSARFLKICHTLGKHLCPS